MVRIEVNSRGRIPSPVLKGLRPTYKSVHTVFINTCVQEYLSRVYNSYVDRSHLDDNPEMDPNKAPKTGRSDDQGNSWEQLRPSTIYKKQKLKNSGGLGSHVRSRKSRAASDVLARIEAIEPISGDGINIRTGQLLAACFPGPIINGRLVKTKDQNIEVKGIGIHFDTNNVPHSQEVESGKRPIIPDEATAEAWMQESVDIALDVAEAEYQRIRETKKRKVKLGPSNNLKMRFNY